MDGGRSGHELGETGREQHPARESRAGVLARTGTGSGDWGSRRAESGREGGWYKGQGQGELRMMGPVTGVGLGVSRWDGIAEGQLELRKGTASTGNRSDK